MVCIEKYKSVRVSLLLGETMAVGIGILLPRIWPRARVFLWAQAERVKVVCGTWPPEAPVLPACTLALRYICTSPMNPSVPEEEGVQQEFYGLVDEAGDIEALLSVWTDYRKPPLVHFELARMGGRKMDIYFDDTLVDTWTVEEATKGRWAHDEEE